ncbi:Gfo/Idh/MocA family oxidoreductase [Candidatus Latescibacterota bacterium]
MSIRIGVIGTGVHGLHHVRLLSSMKTVDFTGIYDSDEEVRRRVSSEFSVKAFDSIEALLDIVDCVSIVVPTSKHFDVVMKCLSKGISVLVEKPISSTVEEAEVMIAEAEKRDVVLSVGHIERFNSAYRSVMSSDISPVFIESHRLAVFNPRGTDVAVVLDLMIHDIDIILNMVKRPAVSVNAVGVSVVSDEVDIANARIEFDNGCVANLTSSRISQKKMRKIRVFKKNSYISMDFLTGESEVFTLKSGFKPEASPGLLPQMMEGISYNKFPNDGLNALELELADFIGAVENQAEPNVTGYDGEKALEIASMVMESMKISARRME